jgi:hypothetical protein
MPLHPSHLFGPCTVSVIDGFPPLNENIHRYVPQPQVLHSDNGTNFVGAERELHEAAEVLNASEEIP